MKEVVIRVGRVNKYIYDSIINESLGKDYNYKVEKIKETNCYYCSKKKTNRCRLEIERSKCINFERRKKYD